MTSGHLAIYTNLTNVNDNRPMSDVSAYGSK